MKRTLSLAVAAVATSTALLAPMAAEAVPGRYFSSCDALTNAWPNGVARTPAAASRAVRDGYSRPATTARARAVYATNFRRLDRDRDGVACEN